MRKTLCRKEDEAKDRTGVKDADRAKDADKGIGCGQRYRMQEGFWLQGAAAGSLLHVFRRLEKRTDGMGHERILAGLVRIIVRHVKLRKNYKNDSKVKIDGRDIMQYDGYIKQTGR